MSMDRSLGIRIGSRLKARRERLGLTQDELARRMGLNHRQTLGTIESGERKIQPDELAAASRALEVPVDFFTDPYSAAGEASFSFRAKAERGELLSEFEERAGRWLATYRTLAKPSLVTQSLLLSPRSSYEDAQRAGEETGQKLGLGRTPSLELEEALDRVWGVLVLHVDAPPGVSGAASRLEGVQAILINRNEPRGRRNYDLAHELFHLLTWDAMPPERIDSEVPSRDAKRMEELAENFAAALLMPQDRIAESWREHEKLTITERIRSMAAELGVTGPAMKWRLYNMGWLPPRDLPSDSDVRNVETSDERLRVTPPLFNARFISRLHRAVEEGDLSVRKAARIVGTDSAGLADLFRSFGRTLSYEL